MSRLTECLAKLPHVIDSDADMAMLADAVPGGAAQAVKGLISNANQEIESVRSELQLPGPTEETYLQNDGEKIGGFIDFSDKAKTIITLIKGEANQSTLPHEIFHIFIQFMQDRIASGEASPELRKSYEAMVDHAGGKLDREGVEKIASLGETYILTARVPSQELAEPFRIMRRWLEGIYARSGTVQGIPGKVPDGLADVFDQWMASEQEMETAAYYYRLNAGASEEMNAALPKDNPLVVARDEAEKRLTEAANKRLERDVARRVNAWVDFSGGRGVIRAKAAEEVAQRPVYAALREIREGKERINAFVAMEDAGEDTVRAIQEKHGKGVVDMDAMAPSDSGVDLKRIAKKHGFASVNEMLSEMGAAETEIDAVTSATDQAIQDRRDEFRSIMSAPEEMPGDAAVHTPVSMDFLVADHAVLQALAEQKKNQAASRAISNARKQAIRDAARMALMQNRSVREATRYSSFSAREAQLAKEAFAAAKRGDWEAAAKAREKQIYQHALVEQSIQIREESRALKRAYSGKKVDAKLAPGGKPLPLAIQDIVRDVVATFGLNDSTRPPKDADPTHIRLPQMKEAEGGVQLPEPYAWVPTWLVTRDVPEDFRDFTDLSFSQVQDLDTLIKQLIRDGRGTLEALNEEKIKTIDEFFAAVTAQEGTNKIPKKQVRDDRTAMGKVTKLWEKFKASGTLPEFVMEFLDGNPLSNRKPIGVLRRFYRAYNEKSSVLDRAIMDTGNKLLGHIDVLKGARDRMEKELWGGARTGDIPGLPMPEILTEKRGWKAPSFEMALAIAFNMGNADNRAALSNSVLGITNFNAIGPLFTSSEWDAIQSIGDMLEEMFPEYQRVIEETYNRRVPRVEFEPFIVNTADGKVKELKGWYYPIVHDVLLSDQVSRAKDVEVAQQDAVRNSVYRTQDPQSGHSIARVRNEDTGEYAGKQPPLLELDNVLWPVMTEMLKITHLLKVVKDWDSLTRDPRFEQLVTEKLGKEYFAQIRASLANVAKPERKSNTVASMVLNKMKALTVRAALGYKVLVPFSQRTALINTLAAMHRAGPNTERYFQDAVSFVGAIGMATGIHSKDVLDFVYSRSDVMATRDTNVHQGIRQASDALKPFSRGVKLLGREVTLRDFDEGAFSFYKLHDKAVTIVAWITAYQQAMGENLHGITEKSTAEERERLAIDYADMIIQMSQPSARPGDLTGMQRDEGPLSMFTMMMAWPFKQGGIMSSHFEAYKAGTISFGKLAEVFATDVMLPAWAILIPASLFYNDDDKPKWTEYLVNPAVDTFAWIPLLKDTVGGAQYGARSLSTPALEGPKRLVQTYQYATDAEAMKAAFAAWKLAEWATGVPLSNFPMDFYRHYKKLSREGN